MSLESCKDGEDCIGEPLPADWHAAGKNYGNPYAPLRSREPELKAMMNMLEQAHPHSLEAMQAFVVSPPNNPTAVRNALQRFRVLCGNCTECPFRENETDK